MGVSVAEELGEAAELRTEKRFGRSRLGKLSTPPPPLRETYPQRKGRYASIISRKGQR
jgi:hypothetical protein